MKLTPTADVAGPPTVSEQDEVGGHYRLVRALGKGGMGTVYSARDLRADRLVALKVMRGVSGRALYRLKNEFRTLTDLQHRNIIVPYELFVHGGMLCYSMELVDGKTIVQDAQRAPDRGKRLQQTLAQLVDALDAVHGHGIIHRDLKPENILVTPEGRVVLLDFGIAKTLSDTVAPGITQERAWLGTPAYMAPEQFQSATPSTAADLYALGAVIYECATGRLAFPQSDISDLIDAKHARKLPTLDGLGDLEPIVLDLLDPEPTGRPTAAEVRRALQASPALTILDAPREAFSVGRRRELARLREVVKAADDEGRAKAASIRGENGIGKTHLLDKLAAAARRDGAFVAGARCSALEALPLRLVDDLLDDVISQARSDSRVPIERCYPRHAAEMCRSFPCTAVLFGSEHPHGKTDDSRGERELALGAVSDLLARLAEHNPLVLCIDDLHRSDEDGLDALLRIALELSESPVTFVFSSTIDSETDASPVDRFLDRWQKHTAGGLESIVLEPMPEEQLVAIAWNELTSWSGPSSSVEELCREAQGNPGMCIWYARALSETDGDDPMTDGGALGPAIFDQAWKHLSDRARTALGYLALAGGELPRAVLRPLLGAAEADLAILDLEHAGFLLRSRYADASSVCLWHGRIAHDVDALRSDDDRNRGHAELSRAFSDCGAHGRAAEHARAHGDVETAREQFGLAADRARRGHAHRQAIDFLRAALELDPDDIELKTDLADSLTRVGHSRTAADLFAEVADATDDADAAAELRNRAIGLFGSLAEVDRVRELLRRQRPDDRSANLTGPRLLLRLIGLRLSIWARPPWKSEGATERNTTAARDLDALWMVGSRLLHIDPIFATTACSEHMQLAFETHDEAHQARALAFEAVVMTSSGEKKLTQASTLLAAAERRAHRIGDEVVRAYVHQGAGFMWGNVGRYREAIVEGRRCIECLETAPNPPAYELGHAHVELGWRLTMIGELTELLTTVPALLRHAIECEDPVLVTAFEIQLAMAYLAADRPDEARSHLDSAVQWCPETYEVGRFGSFIGQTMLELYEGNFEALHELLTQGRPKVEKLRLLGLPAVRAIYRYRVASILLVLAANDVGADPEAMKREATKLCRRIASEPFGMAVAHARLLEAGLRSMAGADDEAMGLLREAVDRFAALGWENLSLQAKIAYLARQGASDDPALSRELERLGVRNPTIWSRAGLPPLHRPKSR
jgi:tetratricopeptide (TPR) repeat protein